MRVRTRKLVGTVVLLLFLFAYVILAASIGAARLASASPLVSLAYFLVVGLAWVYPAGFLIRWMQRPEVEAEIKRR